MTNELDLEIVETALNKMTEGGWFSICVFDQCVSVLGVIIPGEINKRLHALHCVHFNQMTPMVQEFVRLSCAELFNLPEFALVPKQITEKRKKRWLIG